MGRAERVIDINTRAVGQFFRKGRFVRFFLAVVTNIFEEQNVAWLQRVRRLFHLFADAIVHERDRPMNHVREPGCDGPQRHRHFALAFGSAEMGGENDARALFNQQFERWERLLDARHIVDGHLPVFFLHGHVVIDAHKDAFAAHVQFSNRQLGHIKTGAKE